MKITVTTLNLQGFESWQDHQPHVLEYLRRLDPDIILLQEVVYLPEISPHTQAKLLQRALRYPFFHSSVSRLQKDLTYDVYREGLAVMSKYPIVNSDVCVLKHDPRDQHNRLVQFIDMQMDAVTVKLANVHLSLTHPIDFATPQLNEIFDMLDARHEKRIIAGDFNLDNLAHIRRVHEQYVSSSSMNTSLTHPSTNQQIDYILIPKGSQFQRVSLSDDTLSDHRAVTATIEYVDAD